METDKKIFSKGDPAYAVIVTMDNMVAMTKVNVVDRFVSVSDDSAVYRVESIDGTLMYLEEEFIYDSLQDALENVELALEAMESDDDDGDIN
jgi:hypothetical protein